MKASVKSRRPVAFEPWPRLDIAIRLRFPAAQDITRWAVPRYQVVESAKQSTGTGSNLLCLAYSHNDIPTSYKVHVFPREPACNHNLCQLFHPISKKRPLSPISGVILATSSLPQLRFRVAAVARRRKIHALVSVATVALDHISHILSRQSSNLEQTVRSLIRLQERFTPIFIKYDSTESS